MKAKQYNMADLLNKLKPEDEYIIRQIKAILYRYLEKRGRI